MESTASALSPVRLASNAFRIHGKSEILLCASLFYFRIPRALWRERMMQLKSYGYNCIDVYFPWNYHEPQEGVWDFDGEKDIAAFLRTAKEVGLWVVARPGPYICSEWDGGGIPAYLYPIDGMKLRDNNPAFLNATSKWFDRVLPVLRTFQAGADGTIVCVQLDNELDFYGCADPNGYISALRDMAHRHGIAVPLIACAGQGGLVEASGLADGVVPTCNFYPNDRDPAFEDKVSRYRKLLEGMGLPLLVTETNRSHFLLRRLLSCGGKLLGPYLQASGTDFGFTNATNNWGKPLAFLTSDYDFGGMISPEGHIRPEAYEGKLLARIITAYGTSLAEAEPAAKDAVRSVASPKDAIAGCHALKLRDGGYLGFVSHIGEAAAEVSFEANGIRVPRRTKLIMNRWRSLALPFGVPLRTWGAQGTLLYATAELFHCRRTDSNILLAFHTEGEGEIGLRIDGATLLDAANTSVTQDGGTITLSFASGELAFCKLQLPEGRALEIVGMDRAKALLMEELAEDGAIRFAERIEYPKEAVELSIPWSLSPVPAYEPPTGGDVVTASKADYLETFGIYRGFAWYETTFDPTPEAAPQGILVQNGSDVISLYRGKEYVATVVPGGASRYVPIGASEAGEKISARVEIWGHSNFDDIRLPSLRLHAMKGLTGLVSVIGVTDLSRNWRVTSVTDRTVRDDLASPTADDALWPVVGFGGWLSERRPALEYYRNEFQAASRADSWTLRFEDLQALARVFVNGEEAGEAAPSNPYVDISPFVRPGESVQLTVFVERYPGLSAGKATLYEGVSAKAWRISSCGEGQLWANARSARGEARTELPIDMNAGETAWLLGEIGDSNGGKGWRVRAKGANLKLSVWFNGHLVGRLWLQGSRARPAFTGGNQESFYLPGPWFREERAEATRLAVLLEALDGETPSRLEDLSFIPV
ncbi:beta-galactosidase [Paenibacillus sp.]|uniref:beta-galactosidase n=1 Tax=Paenibacillus sp. TaxID=58172 RepID=UPI0028125F85|nr:beta-galactosidase [Paenibacillus sp.]